MEYVANYYEFICAGITSNDIDRRLIDNTLGSMMQNFYTKCRPFIDDAAGVDDAGKPTKSTFEHIYRVLDQLGRLPKK